MQALFPFTGRNNFRTCPPTFLTSATFPSSIPAVDKLHSGNLKDEHHQGSAIEDNTPYHFTVNTLALNRRGTPMEAAQFLIGHKVYGGKNYMELSQ